MEGSHRCRRVQKQFSFCSSSLSRSRLTHCKEPASRSQRDRVPLGFDRESRRPAAGIQPRDRDSRTDNKHPSVSTGLCVHRCLPVTFCPRSHDTVDCTNKSPNLLVMEIVGESRRRMPSSTVRTDPREVKGSRVSPGCQTATPSLRDEGTPSS